MSGPITRLAYPVAEAAHQIGVHPATIYRYIERGMIRTFKFGGRRLIRHDDLQDALDRASGRTPEAQRSDDGGGGKAA